MAAEGGRGDPEELLDVGDVFDMDLDELEGFDLTPEERAELDAAIPAHMRARVEEREGRSHPVAPAHRRRPGRGEVRLADLGFVAFCAIGQIITWLTR